MGWLLGILLGAAALVVVPGLWLATVLAWHDKKTNHSGYFGLPPDGRADFARRVRFHARILRPFLAALARLTRFDLSQASFVSEGLAGPNGSCSPDTFAAARAYPPRSEDVFVVTQMKCGTTWMQHVLYEVLERGQGDLVESGRTLYGVSPWLESTKSVSMPDAPLFGAQRPSRIIKTHLPFGHCPFDEAARYIYVTRHPAACFASCVDFLAANLGDFLPPMDALERWFTSPTEMWWGTWTDHVGGWWTASKRHPNVLFVTFEQMKEDLESVVTQIADFLEIDPLDADEMSAVLEKSSFRYMSGHAGVFEMQPPHVMTVDAELFKKGTADRHLDAPAATRERIVQWAADGLSGNTFPFQSLYPAD